VVIIRIIHIFVFVIVIYYSNFVFGSQIYDYETEKFIEKINNEILSVNNYKKKIHFRIIDDETPNAFINHNNELFISSGLIVNAPDYVAFLAVLAHEIGHLEKYHIAKKKDSIENLKSINALGSLTIIAGSLISNNPEMINALTVNQVGINNFYINFSKDQEREADLYAIETLNKLNLSPNSVKQLLKILEKEALSKGFNEDMQKFSTHPIFRERYTIIDEKKNEGEKTFNTKLNDEFNFIKAKFLGYSRNEKKIKLSKHPEKYYKAIKNSKSGNLFLSLKLLNELIVLYPQNIYLIETKADILISYGYKNEAIKFYEKVLNFYPDNKYAQLRIFNNKDLEELTYNQKDDLFNKNINLLFHFQNNNKIISKFFKLANYLNKKNWVDFFNLIKNKNKTKKSNYDNKLKNIKNKTNDNNLIKLINIMHKK